MSDYPSTPSFGGHSNFPQQWPSYPPSTSHVDSNGHYQQNHAPFPPFPPNFEMNANGFNANGQIPGLAEGNNGYLQNPAHYPFPPQFPPVPFPGPFGAPPFTPLGFPSFPPPMQQQQQNHEDTRMQPSYFANANSSEEENTTRFEAVESAAPMELEDMEEGELSDGDDDSYRPELRAPLVEEDVQMVRTPQAHQGRVAASSDDKPADASIKIPGLVAHPPAPNKRTLELREEPVTEQKRTPQTNGKSASQLQLQAQGALLGLYPHNIRFEQLVDEGIDPEILRRLYKEIGVKVTPAVPGKDKGARQTEPSLSIPEGPPAPNTKSPISVTEVAPKRVEPGVQAPKESKNGALSGKSSSKPVERKDLIARMLAAKAAKPASVASQEAKTTAQTVGDAPGKPITVDNASLAPDAQASQAIPQTSTESRTKEKNKAQTELARQRIEQLKRQGLNRNQSRSDSEGQPPAPGQPINSNNATPQLNHPLPSRPPEVEPVSARIPGLFMTQSETAELTESPLTSPPNGTTCVAPQSSRTRVPRKRPRASDFTDDVDTEPQKRRPSWDARIVPDRVVIDISDDESAYGADDDRPQVSSALLNRPLPRQQTTRDFPPLSDFPRRYTYSNKSTPVASNVQTPSKAKDEAELQMEIFRMNQKIAEMERKKKEKQAASQAQSPRTSSASATTSVQEPMTISNGGGVEGSAAQREQAIPSQTEVQRGVAGNLPAVIDLEKEPTSPVTNPDRQLRSQSIVSRASLDPSKLDEMRQKIMRKKEIESGIPMLDAELLKSEERLARFREEEQRLLAEIEKGKAGKRRLMEELQGIGVETDGLTMEELIETKNRLDEGGLVLENNEREGEADDTFSPPENILEPRAPIGQEAVPPQGDHAESKSEGLPQTSQEAIEMSMRSREITEEDAAPEEVEKAGSTYSSSAMDESTGSVNHTPPEGLEQRDAPMAGVSESSEPMVESSEEPSGQVSAPPSGSEGEIRSVSPKDRNAPGSPAVSIGSDMYEPPEPNENMETRSPISTPPFSPAPAEPLDATDSEIPSYTLAQDVEGLTLNAQKLAEPASEDVSDDLQDDEAVDDTRHHYVPYDSPLKFFKAYRYHPDYIKDINGGYRSLTYSHNIDPNRCLCAYETAGGICNDNSCKYQHLRDISLSDDKVLVEMGSLREGKTAEEKENYVAGLKQIINDMRRDKVKDFNTVATEIAAYRRRFLQDPSRVLAL